MNEAVLLSPTDVSVIRRYVRTKYAPLPDARKAEIVADAIRRTIETRLPDWSEPLKQAMTRQLIARCVVGEQRDVSPEDVLDSCRSLGSVTESDVMPLLTWLNERTAGGWTAAKVAERMGILVSGAGEAMDQDEQTLSVGAKMILQGWKSRAMLLLAAATICGAAAAVIPWASDSERVQPAIPDVQVASPAPLKQPAEGLPAALRYTEIDIQAVKTYLQGRDSLLAEEPYFSAIVASAKKHDIHPLLLIAITGQEQGFVPKSNKQAKKIANNPFNVFHSWKDYNTDIADAASIAAALLAKLGRTMPEGHEPFAWFNRTYAEDTAWSDGVRKIFEQLNSLPPSS